MLGPLIMHILRILVYFCYRVVDFSPVTPLSPIRPVPVYEHARIFSAFGVALLSD